MKTKVEGEHGMIGMTESTLSEIDKKRRPPKLRQRYIFKKTNWIKTNVY